jgi:hypothetical protein
MAVSRWFTEAGRSSASLKMMTLGLSSTPRARMSPKSRSNVSRMLASARARATISMSGALQAQRADVHRFMAELL